MNPIRTIRRLACTLTALAAALAAVVAGAPAAFAQPGPPPGPPAEVVRFGPAVHTFNGVTGDMTGWQITLIAVGAAIVGAVVGVLVDRARAARHRPATAA
jgi:heme A synthase